MLRNFISVAIRSFLNQRFYSAISIIGLSSGLAAALFIFLWVKDEISINAFHQDIDRIYRTVSNLKLEGGEIITWPITPGPLADDIRENVAEVELAVRTMDNGNHLFQHEDKGFLERGLYADSSFFQLFSFPLVKGNAANPGKSTVAISRRLASNLFGDEEPIGKVVKVAERFDLEVAVVFENVGPNSSIKFEYLLPFELYRQDRGQGFNWSNYDHPLYLRLAPHTDVATASAKINALENERVKDINGKDESDLVEFYLQPLADSHLNANFENGRPAGGRIQYVTIFSVIAIFIVVIACINFMNMATARAASRSREVGVRKVVGAQRSSIIAQFICESVIITLVAMLLAIGVVYLMLPVFNSLVSKQIILDLTDPSIAVPALAIALITGVFAGSYPAFFLSAFKPASVLKASTSQGTGGSQLRRSLVVFQFVLTVVLVASALVIFDQITFIHNKELGYDRQSIISFSARAGLYSNFVAFKNDALQIPGVKTVSKANSSLVQVNNQNSSVKWPGKPESDVFFRTVVVDFDYLETMGVELKEGRTFSTQFNDSLNLVVSEYAAEIMGMPNPVGQRISQWGSEGTIVGVVKDLHTRSLHEAIDPIIFLCSPNSARRIFIRIEEGQGSGVVGQLEALAKKYSPEYPFEYTYVDQDFDNLYSTEKVTASLAIGFTTMAIIISGLGLVGLAAFTAEKRKKEIGIRKSLGASASLIVGLISRDFVRLTLIAVILGLPLAWFLMDRFLEGYAYHTDLDWKLFALTAAGVIVGALATVIFQVTRSATANPVDALRNE